MQRKFDVDVTGHISRADVKPIEYLVWSIREELGILGRPVTLVVSNRPMRGARLIEVGDSGGFDYCKIDGAGYHLLCKEGFKKLGIKWRSGGKLWVKEVKKTQ